jgi:hypothetical protein
MTQSGRSALLRLEATGEYLDNKEPGIYVLYAPRSGWLGMGVSSGHQWDRYYDPGIIAAIIALVIVVWLTRRACRRVLAFSRVLAVLS